MSGTMVDYGVVDRDAMAVLMKSFEDMFMPKIAPSELKKFNDWKEEYRKEKGMEAFNISLNPDMDPSTTADQLIAGVLAMEAAIAAGDFTKIEEFDD